MLSPVAARYLDDWYRWLHIPPEYAKAPNIIYFLLVPFLAVWAIVWGLLTKIRIFGGMERVTMLISLLFAIALIYYGWMFKVVHFLMSFGSTFAFIVFMVVFVVGITLYSKRKIKGDWKGSALKELKQKEKELKEKKRLLRNYRGDLRYASEERKTELNQLIGDLKTEIKEIEARLDVLRRDIKTEP
jgi:type VI protein secretion system component VasK